MDNEPPHRSAPEPDDHSLNGDGQTNGGHSHQANSTGMNGSSKRVENNRPPMIKSSDAETILSLIHAGELMVVDSQRRNGLILYKHYHAEFAGPGAAVGGFFDEDCHRVIPVGDFSLVHPDDHEERQRAYLIRRQWIRLTQQFTDKSSALQRAQMILNQFETYFDPGVIARIPDESFALLVGVLPYTVRMARRPPGPTTVKVKS